MSDIQIAQLYLNKIGFNGVFSPTLENLKTLLSLHIRSIPFGNISPLIHQKISLQPSEIANKLLIEKREGYCLEHSTLTKIALQQLGYQTTNVLGRVYYRSTDFSDTPKLTHLVTLVTIENISYLFDPGFGGMTPATVLPLDQLNQTQETSLEPFRLVHVQDSGIPSSALTDMQLMLQVCIADEWSNIYAFNPQREFSHSDFEMANWYVSTSPESKFTVNLMLAIAKGNTRYTMNNTLLRTHNRTHSTSKTIESSDEFENVLTNIFQIKVDSLDLTSLFQKIQNPT